MCIFTYVTPPERNKVLCQDILRVHTCAQQLRTLALFLCRFQAFSPNCDGGRVYNPANGYCESSDPNMATELTPVGRMLATCAAGNFWNTYIKSCGASSCQSNSEQCSDTPST